MVCVVVVQLEVPLRQTVKDKMMKLAEAVTDIGMFVVDVLFNSISAISYSVSLHQSVSFW